MIGAAAFNASAIGVWPRNAAWIAWLTSVPTSSPFEVRMNQSLSDTRLLNAKPMHGDLGLIDPALLTPGRPDRSLIVHRMTLPPGHGRMPQLGTTVVDEPAVRLMRDWVAGMRARKPE